MATHPGFRFVACVAVNHVVAWAILESSYGSVFFMSDDDRSSIVWVPLLVGVAVGLVQALSFGIRITAIASIVSVLLGIPTIVTFGEWRRWPASSSAK